MSSTAVTNVTELLFINGGLKEDDDRDKTVGDILKDTDKQPTWRYKFTEYQIAHRQQVKLG